MKRKTSVMISIIQEQQFAFDISHLPDDVDEKDIIDDFKRSKRNLRYDHVVGSYFDDDGNVLLKDAGFYEYVRVNNKKRDHR